MNLLVEKYVRDRPLNRKKIFSYVTEDRYTYLNDTVQELKKSHNKASKSKLIELGLIELEKNNNIENIEHKLKSYYMDF